MDLINNLSKFPVVKIFPTIILFMYAGSAIIYGAHSNWQQMTYWIAAFMITYSVTWM